MNNYLFHLNLFVLIAMCIVVMGCGSASSPHTPTQIGNEIGISLPASATISNYSHNNGSIDPVWAAEISIPSNAPDSWLKQLKSKSASSMRYTPSLAPKLHWWSPHGVIFELNYENNGDYFVMSIVTENANGHSLYVECSTMY